MWIDCVEKLSKAATKSPQAAYTALSKSLQCEWSYLQRVMLNCGDAFVPLQDAIFKALYPAWSEGDLSDAECTKVVVEAIKGCVKFSFACHLDAINRARHESRNALEEVAKQKLDTILATLSPGRQRAIMKIVESKTPSWLTTLPYQSCHAAKFDGCGADFTLQHALDFKKGGLVILCHNEIHDCIGDLASQVRPQVIKEPVVNEATVTTGDPGLRLDLGIRGVWQPQVEALFDVRVVDTDTPSHCHRAQNAILESSSQEKKRMYKTAVEDRSGTITSSVDGLLHKEASCFLRHMATALAVLQVGQSLFHYVRSRLAFAGVQEVSLCLRGSSIKYRSGLGFLLRNLEKLFDNSTPIDRARLLSISSPHASAWLSVTPSRSMGLHLEPSEFQVAIKWWLGIPVAQGQSCSQCNAALDAYGHHALCCKLGGDVVSRHNRLRDIFNDFCHSACLAPQLEMGGWSRDRIRPANVLVPKWVLGKPAAFDLSVTIFQEACVTAGSAALAAQIRKHRVNAGI
eukprot:Em0012g341a